MLSIGVCCVGEESNGFFVAHKGEFRAVIGIVSVSCGAGLGVVSAWMDGECINVAFTCGVYPNVLVFDVVMNELVEGIGVRLCGCIYVIAINGGRVGGSEGSDSEGECKKVMAHVGLYPVGC